MGKNATHKAMKASRGGGGGGAPDPALDAGQGVDASFHTSEWHAARLAALTVERPSYEDWKQKQQVAAAKEADALEEQEKLMREYKEGLEADRAKRLGLTDAGVKKKKSKKDKKRKKRSKDKKRKDKKDKKHKKHKKKKRRHSSSSSDSDSRSPSSSSTSSSSSDSEAGATTDGGAGPVRLSSYLWGDDDGKK